MLEQQQAPLPSMGCPSQLVIDTSTTGQKQPRLGLGLLGICFSWTLGVVVLQVNDLGGLFSGATWSGALQVPGQGQARC